VCIKSRKEAQKRREWKHKVKGKRRKKTWRNVKSKNEEIILDEYLERELREAGKKQTHKRRKKGRKKKNCKNKNGSRPVIVQSFYKTFHPLRLSYIYIYIYVCICVCVYWICYSRHWLLVTANVFPSSPIRVTLIVEGLSCSETSVLTHTA
jgi:hypothetical protein